MEDEVVATRMPDGERRDMETRKQSPSLGRVVLFTPGVPEHERANGATEYPAIIGQVFADAGNPRPYCNLFVMPPFGVPSWEGSVQEAQDGEDSTRTWRWPPRV